jgi:plasmid stabilization system protein ParE
VNTYVLDPEAQRDLEAYVLALATDDIMEALRLEDRVALALDQLAEQPELGHETSIEGHATPVRAHPLPDTPLVAFYRAVPEGVRILGVAPDDRAR